MPQRLLTLPLRATAAAAHLTLSLTERSLHLACSAISFALPVSKPSPPSARPAASQRPPRSPRDRTLPTSDDPPAHPDSSRPRTERIPQPPLPPQERLPTPLSPTADAVKTVDDEPELVAEFAEPGAEDGAGAEVGIGEPWDGYSSMNAEAVTARIGEASPAELVVIELYEQAHRKRQTVLSAAKTQLSKLPES
jgi:hypothetical protein